MQDTKTAIISSEDPQRLTTQEARLSYPNLFTPRKDDHGKDKWDCVLIFDKEGFDKKVYNQIVIAAGTEAFGADFIAKVKAKQLEIPTIHDGAEKPDDPALGPTKLFIRCSSTKKPKVVDQAVAVIPDTESHRVYAGCYVRAAIRAFSYEYKKPNTNIVIKRGVSFGLQNVQLLRDGEPLGSGGSDPTTDFGPVAKIGGETKAGNGAAADEDDLLGGASGGDTLTDELSI